MKIKTESYFTLFLLLLGAAVILLSFTTLKNRVESMALPIAMGSVIIILATWQLWTEFAESRTQEMHAAAAVESMADNKEKVLRLLSTIAWIVGGAIGIFLTGFYVGITLLVLFYLKVNKRPWSISIAVSVINTALTYLIFEFSLGTALYPGLIYNWISKLQGY